MSKRAKRVPLGKDLRLQFDSVGADLTVGETGDVETVSESQNLAQAILARLSTSKGELSDLGHPEYGSRLTEAIGQPNTQRARERIRRLVMECLGEEQRIEEIISVAANANPHDQNRVDVEIVVRPSGEESPLAILFPLNLEVG